MAKCLHGKDILSGARNSLLIGSVIGLGIGVVIVVSLVCWIKRRSQPKPSSIIEEDPPTASSVATPRKVLRPPRRNLEQQISNSTNVSTDDQSERSICYTNGVPGISNQGTPLRREENHHLTLVHENDYPFHPMPYNYHDTDNSEYVAFESAYPQHKKERNSYVNLSKMECLQTTYANVTDANDSNYDYITTHGARALISRQPETQHGYLFMGNTPQNAHYRNPPR